MKEVELAAHVQQHRRRKDLATAQLVAVLSNAISPLAKLQRLLSQQGLQEQNFCCTVKFLGFLVVGGVDTVPEHVTRA